MLSSPVNFEKRMFKILGHFAENAFFRNLNNAVKISFPVKSKINVVDFLLLHHAGHMLIKTNNENSIPQNNVFTIFHQYFWYDYPANFIFYKIIVIKSLIDLNIWNLKSYLSQTEKNANQK